MAKQVINEVQSKAYIKVMETIKDALINDMGLSDIEANYITAFYTAVKEKDLFNSKYFKDFEYEGEKFNLNDTQKFAKYPESFYDIVIIVLHSGAFTNKYDIDFDGLDVTLNKKDTKKVKEKNKQRTPFDRYKVAEDENYYTFYMPTAPVAASFRTFYAKTYPDDPDIKYLGAFFFSSWCVVSSSADYHFRNERHRKDDRWLVTYYKGNPAERLRQYFNVSSLKDNEDIVKQLLSSSEKKAELQNQLGEIFLMTKDNDLGPGHNYGYHPFTNPARATETTAMNIPISYSYFEIDIDGSGQLKKFDIEDGKLLECYLDNEVVVVPNGVTSIEEGAFKQLIRVQQVVLPPSTRIIKSGAFEKMQRLKLVSTKNTLEVIESNAFVQCPYYATTMYEALTGKFNWRSASFDMTFFAIGVVSEDKDFYTIKKPSQLRYAPKDMLKAFKVIQKESGGGGTAFENTNKKIEETFRVKRNNYTSEALYSIEGKKLILDADKEAAKDVKELILPEGPELITGSFENYKNVETLVFPSTAKKIKNLDLSNGVVNVDMSKSQIEEIDGGIFTGSLKLEEVEMPKYIKRIGNAAFYGTGISSIFIPAGIESVGLNAFDNCPLLMTVYTDDVKGLEYKLPEKVLAKFKKQQIQIEKEH